jgi:DNA-binding transcriptional MerR regulator|uniref:MerR family transcriptional regulator n=1 Tax=uncultured Flavobacteriia bacterium TaxID=212695 RepID=F4MLT7_9BACT|nr:transcriptional regulator, MerR family [uncultured bacterium]CBL87100.1 MerR family transcriptional regulator [uncultured Flavobacteriia bacterium]|tara:strand:+ start:263 stop:604 length:342 start_codon:yes stop_codon:yes gene_type:complete
MTTNDWTKNYYSIGEVAKIFNLNTSALRFWEKEFPELNPKKNSRGVRKYTPENMEVVRKIHHLIKDRGFTIKGARKKYKTNSSETINTEELVNRLLAIKNSMETLKKQLDIIK